MPWGKKGSAPRKSRWGVAATLKTSWFSGGPGRVLSSPTDTAAPRAAKPSGTRNQHFSNKQQKNQNRGMARPRAGAVGHAEGGLPVPGGAPVPAFWGGGGARRAGQPHPPAAFAAAADEPRKVRS